MRLYLKTCGPGREMLTGGTRGQGQAGAIFFLLSCLVTTEAEEEGRGAADKGAWRLRPGPAKQRPPAGAAQPPASIPAETLQEICQLVTFCQ